MNHCCDIAARIFILSLCVLCCMRCCAPLHTFMKGVSVRSADHRRELYISATTITYGSTTLQVGGPGGPMGARGRPAVANRRTTRCKTSLSAGAKGNQATGLAISCRGGRRHLRRTAGACSMSGGVACSCDASTKRLQEWLVAANPRPPCGAHTTCDCALGPCSTNSGDLMLTQ